MHYISVIGIATEGRAPQTPRTAIYNKLCLFRAPETEYEGREKVGFDFGL